MAIVGRVIRSAINHKMVLFKKVSFQSCLTVYYHFAIELTLTLISFNE